MSAASSIPYKLRPNKSVDRELFLSLLMRLGTLLQLEKYKYVGLGGPFLEDFRLVHNRVGISDMDCIEAEENVHKRQLFNSPIESIDCIHSTLESYLYAAEFEKPVVLWLDYTDPRSIQTQIETFSDQVIELPIGSIIRVTLNANPSSLGSPDDKLVAGEDLQKWRLDRFKVRLGKIFPATLTAADMTQKMFGRSILRALLLSVESKIVAVSDRKIIWALATNYSDGQSMVTATLMTVQPEETNLDSIVQGWEYHSTPKEPLILDMPALSILERIAMESYDNPKACMNYDLPTANMGEDPFTVFKRFYRVFPHFSRIEL